MRHPIRCIAQSLAAAALLCAASVSADQTASEAEATIEIDDAPTGEQMALDFILVRPLSLAGTLIGTAVFLVSSPFCVIAWNCVDPARRLIVEPATYTFVRDLGDLD